MPLDKKKPGETNTEVICDKNWKCDVVFLYEGDRDGLNLMHVLQQIPAKQIVGNVKVINKSDIIKEAKKSGGKVKKTTGRSTGEDVEWTDEQKITMYVKENATIPGKPLASLIKKQLINMKIEDIKERKKLLSTFEDNQKKKAKLESKGTRRGNRDDKSVTDDAAKTENVFVERPPLFVVLIGFNEHDLPIELMKQDIPLCAVIKLMTSHDHDFERKLPETFSKVSNLSSDKFNMPWVSFWRKFEQIINSPENLTIGNDLATIEYEGPKEFDTIGIKEKKIIAINQLTDIMNYVRNLLEMYRKYRESLVITNITEELTDEKPDLYNVLIQMVPLECTSIPLILFTLIEQICHWNGDEIEINTNTDSKSCNLEDDVNSNINSSPKSKSQTSLKKSVKHSPVIIRNKDEETIKTFHLDIPEIDFNKINIRFLSKSFLLNHLAQSNIDQMQTYFMEFHLQRLWKLTYKEIPLNVFYMYFHFYIFGKMKSYYTSHSKSKRVSGNIIENPIDIVSINSGNHNLLLEWIKEAQLSDKVEFVEHKISHNSVENQQRPKKTTYNTSNNNNGNSVTNINEKNDSKSSNKDLSIDDNYENISVGDIRELTEEKTVNSITKKRNHSLTVLRKFLNCPEILSLYENNESTVASTAFKLFSNYKFIEEMKPASLLQSLHEAVFNYSQIHSVYYYPSNKILLWFHNTNDVVFEEHKCGRIESALGFRDYCVIINKTEHSSGIEKDTTSNKNHNHEMPKEYIKESAANLETRVYNLCNRKLQFDQWTKTFSSADGSSVVVKIDNWYRSSQFVNICIKKMNTEINIYINTYPLLSDDYFPTNNKSEELMKLSLKLPMDILLNVRPEEKFESDLDQRSETQFSYDDLTITLPNGLVIEVLKNSYDSDNIYVKQSFTAKGLSCNKIWDEKCRCFDRSGNIVIFKNDDTIDVLYNNMAEGKIIKIEKVKTIEETNTEVTQSVSTKDSSKKGSRKGKTKRKEPTPVLEEPKVEEEIQTFPYIVTEHLIKAWSGMTYHYRGNFCVDIIDNKVNLRTIFFPYKQLYVDRNDGNKCLFIDDGRLVTTYRDGTMVTSFVHEEPEPISMMMPETEELEFEDESLGVRTSGYFNVQFPNNIQPDIFSTCDESYVSYKIGYIAEHPNYGTVKFSPIDNSITLILPGNLLVLIHNIQSNGKYDITVTVNNKATIEFKKESIYFKSNILKKSKKINVTSISPLFARDNAFNGTYFCKTFDSFGRLFQVDKFGNVKLTESEFTYDRKSIVHSPYESQFYYENYIPKKFKERFFVVNDNFSGYEVLNQKDINLLDKEDEKRFNNADSFKNPTKNRIFSKTNQYRIYKSYSDGFLMQRIVDFVNIVPYNFQRCDLGPTWTPTQSPWLFIRSDTRKTGYRQFSFTHIPKHTDDRIIAVVIKTIQQVADSDNFNGLDIISSCLKKYKIENEKICNKYKQQGFTDYEIDPRLKENQILISCIKKEFPLWNVLRTSCHTCKQTFGSPAKASSDIFNPTSKELSSEIEHVINEINY